MKTVDEVIKAFECCENGEPDSNCEECSYIGIGSCCLERENDAIHYLKEYRDYRNSDKMVIENGGVSDTENKPLKLEEMKQMVGKPVFAYDLWYGLNFWHIIKDIDEKYIFFEDNSAWPIDRLFCDEPSHLFYTQERENA